MGELHAPGKDENKKELEIEYVEGYDELEEEDDVEDFGGFAINESLKNNHDAVEDEEEMDAVDTKGMRRRSESAHGKLEKDEPSAKLKKKARVLVEVEYEDCVTRQKSTL